MLKARMDYPRPARACRELEVWVCDVTCCFCGTIQVSKLEKDVKEKGLSVVILAEWYNEEVSFKTEKTDEILVST